MFKHECEDLDSKIIEDEKVKQVYSNTFSEGASGNGNVQIERRHGSNYSNKS